jgi:citrate transporter
LPLWVISGQTVSVYIEIDWPLLVMFVGLFIVVSGFEKVAITPDVNAGIGRQHLDNVAILASVTAVLSNVVSNVPAVLLLKSLIPNLQDPQRAWLIVAMAATLAGNFTLVGSIANLIVAQRAKPRGVELDFWTYFKVSAPITFQGKCTHHGPDHYLWTFVALRQAAEKVPYVRYWNLADNPTAPAFGRFWSNSGHLWCEMVCPLMTYSRH